MEPITAEQAYNLTKEQCPDPQSPPIKLIELIDKRIKVACSNGKYNVSLGSMDDYGNGVRGIGIFFSSDMFQRIKNYYEKLGFTFKVIYDNNRLDRWIIVDAWLKWEIKGETK
jgi:hypothetical protein